MTIVHRHRRTHRRTHLLNAWIITNKLVEPSQGLGVLVLDLSEINPPLEQRVVHADHPIQTQQSVIKDEVVVVYVVVFVCVNEQQAIRSLELLATYLTRRRVLRQQYYELWSMSCMLWAALI